MVFKTTINWKAEVDDIAQAGRDGQTYQQIADKYGVTRERIRQVVRKYIKDWDEVHGRVGRKKIKEENLDMKRRKKWGTHRDLIDQDTYKSQRLKFTSKKAQAKRCGWEWTVSFGDLVWPTHCPILGMELDYFAAGVQENSPSFDQIIAGKGYVVGNVQIISWRANRIKNNGTAEEHQLIANYMKSLEGSY